MFMDKNDWSDDDLDDVNEMVVPVDIPTPITYQKGNSGNTAAYNERMARARQSVQIKRQQSSGAWFICVHMLASGPPAGLPRAVIRPLL